MSSKKDYSRKILKILGKKNTVPVKIFENRDNPKATYAANRSVKNLVDADCVEILSSEHQKFLRLTKKGKAKLNSILVEGQEALVPQGWDGFWRIILLDLPEDRKSERDSLRYLLRKAGFVCLKNSAWISPFPYEHLFENIKKDLGLTHEMMIIVTESIDTETKKNLFTIFGTQ